MILAYALALAIGLPSLYFGAIWGEKALARYFERLKIEQLLRGMAEEQSCLHCPHPPHREAKGPFDLPCNQRYCTCSGRSNSGVVWR